MTRWLGLGLLCICACRPSAPGAGVERAVSVPEQREQLVGLWRKDTDVPCAAQYAAHLRIDGNGLYFGTSEPPGEFTWWDGGTWQVTAPGRLALSTANDAVVEYSYDLQEDLLTITDATGCRFSYRRSS